MILFTTYLKMLPFLPSYPEEMQQLRFTVPQLGTCYVCHQFDDVSGVVGLQFILWQFECNDLRKCRLCVVDVYIYIYIYIYI